MLQISLWITSYDVYGLVTAKLGWVDPASFAVMESDTHLLYFTKLSGKSLDFYFLVGIHLNLQCFFLLVNPEHEKECEELRGIPLTQGLITPGRYGSVAYVLSAGK